MINLLLTLLTTISFANSPYRDPLPKREMSITSQIGNLQLIIKTQLSDKESLEKEVDKKCIDFGLSCEIESTQKNLDFIIKIKTIGNEKNVFLDMTN